MTKILDDSVSQGLEFYLREGIEHGISPTLAEVLLKEVTRKRKKRILRKNVLTSN